MKYLAVVTEDSGRHVAREFDTIRDAQHWAEMQTPDPHALLKVYAGEYDEEGEWVDRQDYYYDGKEWTE